MTSMNVLQCLSMCIKLLPSVTKFSAFCQTFSFSSFLQNWVLDLGWGWARDLDVDSPLHLCFSCPSSFLQSWGLDLGWARDLDVDSPLLRLLCFSCPYFLQNLDWGLILPLCVHPLCSSLL